MQDFDSQLKESSEKLIRTKRALSNAISSLEVKREGGGRGVVKLTQYFQYFLLQHF